MLALNNSFLLYGKLHHQAYRGIFIVVSGLLACASMYQLPGLLLSK